MLDAGGGGGGTPWESMTIQAMQTLIQNPDTEKHWNLVNGWTKSADLINEHRFQVQNYRDNLAAAWPPERSAASAAYLARLDALIASLSETYEAAVANHDAFSTATLSLSLAQTDMQKIFDEYQANEQLLLDFKTTQEAKQNSGTPQPTPSPSGEQPPVAPDRQEQLRQKAVTLLHGVSTELAQAQLRLITPKPYRPAEVREEKPSLDGSDYVAPPIAPIVPSFQPDNGAGNSSRPVGVFPNSPNLIQPANSIPSIGSQQPGLILGGTNPTTFSPPTVSVPSPAPSPPLTNMPSPPAMMPPTGPIHRGGSNVPIPPSPNTSIGRSPATPREGFIRPVTPTTGGVHVMPPGGLIGGNPVTGLGQPGTTRPTTRRINPIGGMIGDPSPNGSSAVRGGIAGDHASGYGNAYHQAGSRKPDPQGQDRKSWDPNNPWETTEGVPPIVMPPREQRIDPGPAIGLP